MAIPHTPHVERDDLNRQLVLRARPTGEVTDDCFELVSTPVPEPAPGEVGIRTSWLGIEPVMRSWINDMPSYIPPVRLGEVMRSFGVGEVIASADERYAVGDLVQGFLGWQTTCLARPDDIELEIVPSGLDRPEFMLGVLGLTGLTAYFGMTEIGRVQPGDVVLVTAAAGATGSVAGQVARALGAAHVVGTAGSNEKRAWVRDVAGFDDCVDHYDDKIRRALRNAAPRPYDVIFDNVGGAVLDAALFNMAVCARIALCGAISTGYRPETPSVGLHFYPFLTTRTARIEGFLVNGYRDHYPQAPEVALGVRDAPSGLGSISCRNLTEHLCRADPTDACPQRSTSPRRRLRPFSADKQHRHQPGPTASNRVHRRQRRLTVATPEAFAQAVLDVVAMR